MARPEDLSLRQLQYVVAVADTLGFHKAAARTHVSQPTLSAQLAQIESVLGVKLFERDKRRVMVTVVGADIVERARRILVEVEDLIAAATRSRDPFTGTLRIGVIPTIAPYLLPEVMPAIQARYPKLSLVFREEKTEDIVRDISEGQLEAGIVALEAPLGALAHSTIAVDPFVVAMPKGHGLARKKRLSLDDLEGERVLLLDEGHCLRDQALSLCARATSTRRASGRRASLPSRRWSRRDRGSRSCLRSRSRWRTAVANSSSVRSLDQALTEPWPWCGGRCLLSVMR